MSSMNIKVILFSKEVTLVAAGQLTILTMSNGWGSPSRTTWSYMGFKRKEPAIRRSGSRVSTYPTELSMAASMNSSEPTTGEFG